MVRVELQVGRGSQEHADPSADLVLDEGLLAREEVSVGLLPVPELALEVVRFVGRRWWGDREEFLRLDRALEAAVERVEDEDAIAEMVPISLASLALLRETRADL